MISMGCEPSAHATSTEPMFNMSGVRQVVPMIALIRVTVVSVRRVMVYMRAASEVIESVAVP
jgi:hypothetical protein